MYNILIPKLPCNSLYVALTLQVLRDATKRGVILVNTTQCMHGAVDTIYETGEVSFRGKIFLRNGYDLFVCLRSVGKGIRSFVKFVGSFRKFC